MNKPIKITKVGNSAAMILPKEVLAKLRAGVGDTVHLVETPDGWQITPYDPELAAQLDAAEEIMREDRDILRVLAK